MKNSESGGWVFELCEAYVAALSASDMEGIHAVFAPGSKVVSPVYGHLAFDVFYRQLFADTRSSSVKLVTPFLSGDSAQCAALLQYDWVLRNDSVFRFRCVDVFTLSAKAKRFSMLEIFYDTAAVRESLPSRTA